MLRTRSAGDRGGASANPSVKPRTIGPRARNTADQMSAVIQSNRVSRGASARADLKPKGAMPGAKKSADHSIDDTHRQFVSRGASTTGTVKSQKGLSRAKTSADHRNVDLHRSDVGRGASAKSGLKPMSPVSRVKSRSVDQASTVTHRDRVSRGVAANNQLKPKRSVPRAKNSPSVHRYADTQLSGDAGGGVAAKGSLKPNGSMPHADSSIPDQRIDDVQRPIVGGNGVAATDRVKPRNVLPHAESIARDQHSRDNHDSVVAGGEGATKAKALPIPCLSPLSNSSTPDQVGADAHQSSVGEGEGATIDAASTSAYLSPLSEICATLAMLQRRRAYCIKRQSMADRSTEAHIATYYLGYHSGLPEDERSRIFREATKIRRAVEGGEGHGPFDTQRQYALSDAFPIIIASAKSREAFDDIRLKTEAEMKRLAKTLPVWPFVASVRGVGELGLAVVIGECGDSLSEFRTVSKMWKRLGLAVIDGLRQGGLPKGATAEQWTAHGYSPRRRAEIWSIFSDSMFRQQWAGDKDADGKNPKISKKPVAVPTHPTGPYGEVYLREKEKKLALEWTKGHAHNHARRLMTKEFLKHLWIAWRAASVAAGTRTVLPQPSNTALDRGQKGFGHQKRDASVDTVLNA